MFFFFFFFLRSVPSAYDNNMSSIMTKLNAWSVETRAPWEKWRRCVGVGGLVIEVQNTVRKIQMCPINMTVGHAQTAPAAGRERRERVRGVGASSFCLSLELTTPDSSSFSPLHSVLSSRCQEVAQCLFFFFLLKGCMISHVFFLFIYLRPPELEEQTGSQRVSGRFVCLCFILSPVPWLSH